MQALEKEVTRLQKKLPTASNNVRKFGRSAQGAAAGVGVLDKALKGALVTIAPLLTAVAGLTAGFRVLAAQDFAEAKVRTLGVNSEELRKRLIATSKALKGQASVVELTAASYDVASAGFASAAEAQEILAASSLGAVGGFSDINTVANATTSVLNAYGLSADQAGKLVDGFIQTQNDGKIVLDEYARNIGKLAPIAASLGIPLAEVNGAIAAITANGLPAEIAITALRSGIARLAAPTKEASDILAKYGVEIDANTIANEGLEKSLQKLAKVTDKADLQKLIGTEAGQALAPLLNNLEKVNRLIKNQGDAAGVAQKANDEAANTIAGAWKSVTTAFENLFSEQSELSEALIPLLQGLADAINAINSPAGKAALALTGMALAIGAVTKAIVLLKATSFGAFLSRLIPIIVAGKGALAGKALAAGLAAKAVKGLSLAMKAVPWAVAIAAAFKVAEATYKAFAAWYDFNRILKEAPLTEVEAKIASLTKEMEAAQEKTVHWTEAIFDFILGVDGASTAVSGLSQRIAELNTRKIELQLKSFGDFYGPAGPAGPEKTKTDPPFVPTFSSGGGGGGAKPRESQLPALQAETQLKQRLLEIDKQRLQAQFEENQIAIMAAERAKVEAQFEAEKAKILLESIPLLEQQEKIKQAELDRESELLELKYQGLDFEKQRQATLEGILTPLDDEIELLRARLNGNEEEIRQKQEILRLQKAIREAGGDPAQAESRIKERDALKEQADAAEKLKAQYESLADSIAGSLTGAFKDVITGAKTAEEALATMFQNIADAFIDMAMKMIQEWLKMQILGIVSNAFGGGGLFGGGGGGGGGLGAPKFGSFAEGGYVTGPTQALIGEGGESEYVIPASKMSDAMSNYSMGRRGSSVIDGSGGGGASSGGDSGVIRFESTVINGVEYVTKQEAEAIGQRAARQGAADGAKAGYSKTMGTLRNSRSQRQKLGMS